MELILAIFFLAAVLFGSARLYVLALAHLRSVRSQHAQAERNARLESEFRNCELELRSLEHKQRRQRSEPGDSDSYSRLIARRNQLKALV